MLKTSPKTKPLSASQRQTKRKAVGTKRRFATSLKKQTKHALTTKSRGLVVTQSAAPLSASATSSDDDTIRLKQDTPYNFALHEKRWNSQWNIAAPSKYSNPDAYQPKLEAVDSTAVSKSHRPSFYSLSMFPYPSGDLHMGHVRVYSISDCLCRYYNAKGFNVVHPMGWDAFGLPAENAARDRGISPATWTYSNLKHMRTQLNALGMKFDWGREVATCSPDYYKWTQWVFIALFRMGLAYRKKAVVNWDPIDETVLANEQVDAEGKSWRSGAIVERKELAQWFFKITDYADDLLQGLDTLDEWPATVKVMQSQWIGKKNSAHIDFKLTSTQHTDNLPQPTYTAFTTRPDTLMGVKYVAVLPGHEQFSSHLLKLKQRVAAGEDLFTTSTKKRITAQWIDECLAFADGYDARKADFTTNQRVITSKHRGSAQQKQGADETTVITSGLETPVEFDHPLSGEKIPVFMADYVERGRGTGVVMGVPAHDYNDFAFAKQHKIPVKVVITPNKEKNSKAQKQLDNVDSATGLVIDTSLYTPHVTQTGTMVNSGPTLDEIDASDAATQVINQLVNQKRGKSAPSYQLHDWLVSRQRYWGTPIPIIYCNDGCGPQPVPEGDLPVTLPEGIPLDVKGRSPLASNHPAAVKWRTEVSCPCCGSDNAERETDTLDTFIDSSWYFLRFLSSETHRHNEKLTDNITYQKKFQQLSRELNSKNKAVLEKLEALYPAAGEGKNVSLGAFEDALKQEADQKPVLPWNMKELGQLYPVTQYIGGIEHAILHLLYSRFISYALFDANLVTSKEPFKSLLTQGMVHGESFKHSTTNRFMKKDEVIVENDKGVMKAFQKIVDESTNEVTKGEKVNIVWEKMSKSKGNGVNPDDMVAKYGADVCRMFMLFKAPPEKVLDWDEQSVQGMSRWVNRLHILTNAFVEGSVRRPKKNNAALIDYNADLTATLGGINKQSGPQLLGRPMTQGEENLMSTTAITIQDVTKAMEQRQFNVAIAKLMTLSNEIFDFALDKTVEASSVEWAMAPDHVNSPVYRESLTTLLRLLHPIAPYFTSESFLRIQNAFGGIDYQPTSGDVTPFADFDKATADVPATHDISKLDWPSWDMSWAEQKSTTTVQLNGKLLFTLDTSRDLLDHPDSNILAELCKIDAFKLALMPRLPSGKSTILDDLIKAAPDVIDPAVLNSGFKRVVTKSTPKVNRLLVNFVM